jgi:hypothetical protein
MKAQIFKKTFFKSFFCSNTVVAMFTGQLDVLSSGHQKDTRIKNMNSKFVHIPDYASHGKVGAVVFVKITQN